MIGVKRVYEPASPDDGLRILVDRLWPRGLNKSKAKVDVWLKEIAPSHELRQWYGHDPAKWNEFCTRYRAELQTKPALFNDLRDKASQQFVTLLYASREESLNNAWALKAILGL